MVMIESRYLMSALPMERDSLRSLTSSDATLSSVVRSAASSVSAGATESSAVIASAEEELPTSASS